MNAFPHSRPARVLSSLSLGLLGAFPALAQPSSSQLGEIFVTATRVPQPLTQVLADVTVIERDQIERSGARALADLLARQPGLEFARNGGPAAATSLFTRGAETRHTAVYVDGVRVDSQATGGAPWEMLPLAQIERIEVLRGPAASVYGSDAMAGVVQIFTRKGGEDGQGVVPFAGIGLSTYRTARVEAGVSGKSGSLDYAVSAARETSRGFNARPVAGQNPDLDGHQNTSATANLGLQLNQNHRVEATLLSNRLKTQYDGFGATVDDRSFSRLQTLGLSWKARWSERYRTQLSVGESTVRYETTPSPYQTDTRLQNFTWLNEWQLGAGLATATLERRNDHLVNTPIDRSHHQDGVALGYGLAFGAGQAHSLQANLRHDRDSEFGSHATGSVAYGYRLTPRWRLTASVGNAFRAPTLYQRFSEYGLASLVPEKSRGVEAGLAYVDGPTRGSLVAYRSRVSELIGFGAPSTCASAFGCYENTGRATLQGLTLSGAQRLTQVAGGALNLRGSLDWQRPEDAATGKLLARRAPRRASLGMDWQGGAWTLGGDLLLVSHRFDDAANVNRLGGYGLLGLYASTRLARDWEVLARIDNLADKKYQLARTFAQPGRVFYAGLRWAPR